MSNNSGENLQQQREADRQTLASWREDVPADSAVNTELTCVGCPRQGEKNRFIARERELGSELPDSCQELIDYAARNFVSAACGLSAWEGIGNLMRGTD